MNKSATVKSELEYLKGALLEDQREKTKTHALVVSATCSPDLASQEGFESRVIEEDDRVVTYGIPVIADAELEANC